MPRRSPFARTTNVTAQRLSVGPQESFILSLPSGLVMRPFEVDILLGTAFQGSALIVTRDDNSFKRNLLGAQFRTDVSVSLGLPKDFEVGIRLPFILSQQAEYIGFGLESPPDPSTLGDTQLVGQWQQLKQSQSMINLAHTLTLTIPTGDSETYNSRDSLGAEVRSTASRFFGPVLGALSIGYHYQEARELPDQTDGSRVRLGVGAEYLHQASKLTIDSRLNSMAISRIRYALHPIRCLCWHWVRNLIMKIGNWAHNYTAPYQLLWSPSTSNGHHPRLSPYPRRRPPRCVNDLSYLHDDRCEPPDSDQDGVFDPDDRCPTVAEDRDEFEDEDGCPDPDNDQDKILDEADPMSNEAEDFDEFKDKDGCPDPTMTKMAYPMKRTSTLYNQKTKNGFDDEDSCPEPDDDEDGIPNANDSCRAKRKM